MRKLILTLVTAAAIVGATAGTASAITPISPIHTRVIYFDYVRSTLTGQLLKVDGPFYTLSSAQTDAFNEVRAFALSPWPRGGVTVTIRKIGG
jgi:hypothetical protein